MDIGWIVLVVLVAVAVWVGVSPDPLADAIRVQVFKAKSLATKKLNDAVARAERNKAQTEARLAKAEQDLLTIKIERRRAENELRAAQAEVTRLNTAAENAASIGRADLVELAEKQLAEEWEPKLLEAQKAFDFQLKEQQRLEAAIADFRKIVAMRGKLVAEARTRATSARTRRDVNAAIADLNPDGTDGDMKKAFDQIKEAEAEADVMTEEADKVREKIRQNAELDSLANGPVVPVADRVAARMAKFNKN